MTKQQVKDEIKELDRWSIDGDTLEELAEKIKEWQAQYGEGVKIDIDTSESYGDVSIVVTFYKSRLETEEEYSKRVGKEDAYKKTMRQMREKQYLALKKEFEVQP